MNQDILTLIQENMSSFSKGQKRIAGFIRQHVLVAHPVLGDLDALHGGQTAADHFLQLPLHVGVAPEVSTGRCW